MTRYEIIPATEALARDLAPRMRKADADEVWAQSHRTPLEGLLHSLAVSRDPLAALAYGRVFCLFGVAEPTPVSDIGSPWLLGSNELPRHFRAFLRGSRGYIRELLLEYRCLLNYVDARNAHAISWLRWLGFTIEPAQPFGMDRLPFHRFWIGGCDL